MTVVKFVDAGRLPRSQDFDHRKSRWARYESEYPLAVRKWMLARAWSK
ncbi:hypothetical protein BURMUCGD1_1152 [Burkholderia multivorans CGD1]|nr:hypothetical protein BURMUCGD1_1152 [Burkholderia multivorans CGD1]